jgi:hypothetical protein
VPDAKLLLIFAAALAALVAVVALWRGRRADGPMLTQTRPLPKMTGSLDAGPQGRSINVSLGREILQLLEAGRRVEAVRLVREHTGWGLSEADEAVARLESLKKRLES